MRGVIVAGTHSGCGKTTMSLGLLAAFKKKGYEVQPFKAGPDFIDTGLHKLITGRTSRNLDLWMCGKDYVIECFHAHAAAADISVVEGVMGMYDGNLSTADLAATLGLPVILVVDAYGMAESAGAVVKGFAEYSAKEQKCRSDIGARCPRPELAGVIFNRVASERHYIRLKDSVQDIAVLGYLPRDLDFSIPHRHLGLVVAEEEPIAKEEIGKLADAVLEHIDIEKIVQKAHSAEVQKCRSTKVQKDTSGMKVAVAYDKAFCFYYEDNLDLLRDAGAEIVTFSPLDDSRIPDGIHSLYIGGGYPELYADRLSKNASMLESVRSFAREGGPVYAECGGFMYLTEGIEDFDHVFHAMAGVFPLKTKMKKGRSSLGYREAVLNHDSLVGVKGTVVRGHEFHYSEIEKSSRLSALSFQQNDLAYSVKDGTGNQLNNEGYRVKNTLGSYIHIHFGSNSNIANSFIDFIKEHHGTDTLSRTR